MFYGAKGTINVWNPKIQEQGEYSSSQLWVLGGPPESLNTIEAGWHVCDCFNFKYFKISFSFVKFRKSYLHALINFSWLLFGVEKKIRLIQVYMEIIEQDFLLFGL